MITRVITHLDLSQIAASGQCFTWRRWDAPEGLKRYTISALGRVLAAEQAGEQFSFSCCEEEFESVWRGYLNLDADYGAVIRSIDPGDAFLTAAASYGGGIRILRQDLWEVMVSFLISQNNNITRITRSIEGLCTRFGSALDAPNGWEGAYHAFPRPDQLATSTALDFEALGLGYRAKYLAELARCMDGDGLTALLAELEGADDNGARAALMSLYGIGKKVADCVCLFGLHRIDAFPVDTHIKKILDAHYPTGFPLSRYRGALGILQQYLFYYDLKKS